MIAEAIYKATPTAPREMCAGQAILQSIVGNFFIPHWLGKIMAKKPGKGRCNQRCIHHMKRAIFFTD
jgi:hypothetical protein